MQPIRMDIHNYLQLNILKLILPSFMDVTIGYEYE